MNHIFLHPGELFSHLFAMFFNIYFCSIEGFSFLDSNID